MGKILEWVVRAKWGPLAAVALRVLTAINDALKNGKTDQLSALLYENTLPKKYKIEEGGPCSASEFKDAVEKGEDLVKSFLVFKKALDNCLTAKL